MTERNVLQAAAEISQALDTEASVAVVLGSGLGGLTASICPS